MDDVGVGLVIGIFIFLILGFLATFIIRNLVGDEDDQKEENLPINTYSKVTAAYFGNSGQGFLVTVKYVVKDEKGERKILKYVSTFEEAQITLESLKKEAETIIANSSNSTAKNNAINDVTPKYIQDSVSKSEGTSINFNIINGEVKTEKEEITIKDKNNTYKIISIILLSLQVVLTVFLNGPGYIGYSIGQLLLPGISVALLMARKIKKTGTLWFITPIVILTFGQSCAAFQWFDGISAIIYPLFWTAVSCGLYVVGTIFLYAFLYNENLFTGREMPSSHKDVKQEENYTPMTIAESIMGFDVKNGYWVLGLILSLLSILPAAIVGAILIRKIPKKDSDAFLSGVWKGILIFVILKFIF